MLDKIPFEEHFEYLPATNAEDAHSARFFAFNTLVHISAFGDQEKARASFDVALGDCRRLERLLSKTLPHSDISLLNAARGAAVPIGEETYEVLAGSISFCEQSLGHFDITIGSVLSAWDFHDGIVPEQEKVDSALEHVDFRCLELAGDPGRRTARLKDPFAMVDVGGTAKGYIADCLCDRLSALGLKHFAVNLGGNVAVRGGKPDGSPFSIGVRDPKNSKGALAVIQLSDGSVVTSGLSERCFFSGGRRYAHILNPKTGWPIRTDAESVTVVASSSFACDGFSTTLCSMGIERGIEFVRNRSDLEFAIFVDNENGLHFSWA